MKHSLLITIDVEDWFQVENFKGYIDYSEWHRLQSRVYQNTLMILDLLDRQHIPVKATFYVLGWVAEKCPDLVAEISSRGHEVASHGYGHKMCNEMNDEDLFHDLLKSKKVLEKIIDKEIYGYRAPSFSISNASLALIRKAGYIYDSSYNSFTRHGRYGSITTNGRKMHGIALKIGSGFYELPISNLKFCGQTFPWGGGGYFRILPLLVFKKGIRKILSEQNAYVFYMHPWEIDPQQPRVEKVKKLTAFRHYTNLAKTYSRMDKMIKAFQHCDFITSKKYLEKQGCF